MLNDVQRERWIVTNLTNSSLSIGIAGCAVIRSRQALEVLEKATVYEIAQSVNICNLLAAGSIKIDVYLDNVFQQTITTCQQLSQYIGGEESGSGLLFSGISTQVVASATQITVVDGAPITPFTVAVGGGNVSSTATPLIAGGRDGQFIILRNDNQADSDSFTVSDQSYLSGSGMMLSGSTVTMAGHSVMGLVYSSFYSAWIEQWYLKLATSAAINSFTVDIGGGSHNSQYVEVASGGTLTPTFALTITGTASAGSINSSGGESGYPQSLSSPYTSLVGDAINKGTTVGHVETFTPNVTINGVAFTSPTATITYINTVYMGQSSDSAITSSDILSLADKSLKTSVAGTYAVTVGTGNYLWFCHPASISDLNTIKDNSTGFAIDGLYETNVSHTNASGFTENYRVWRSTNVGIFPSGATVVVT